MQVRQSAGNRPSATDAVTGPCAGRPLSGEERTVGNHDDVKYTVGVWARSMGFPSGTAVCLAV